MIDLDLRSREFWLVTLPVVLLAAVATLTSGILFVAAAVAAWTWLALGAVVSALWAEIEGRDWRFLLVPVWLACAVALVAYYCAGCIWQTLCERGQQLAAWIACRWLDRHPAAQGSLLNAYPMIAERAGDDLWAVAKMRCGRCRRVYLARRLFQRGKSRLALRAPIFLRRVRH